MDTLPDNPPPEENIEELSEIDNFLYTNLPKAKIQAFKIFRSCFILADVIKYIVLLTNEERRFFSLALLLVASLSNVIGFIFPLTLNKLTFISSEVIVIILAIVLYNTDTDKFFKIGGVK